MTQKIDLVNIGLIIASFVLALLLPVRLFLFSYAVLGPLHYMTEIGWLEKRNYFSKKKSDIWILIVLCLVLSIGFVSEFLVGSNVDPTDSGSGWIHSLASLNQNIAPGVIFFAFAAALSFVFLKSDKKRYLAVAAAAVLALFVHQFSTTSVIFGVYVPTIVHVSLFTAVFMLYGALKSKSQLGYVSVALFVIGCIAIFWIDVPRESVSTDPGELQILLDSTFIHLGASLAQFFGLTGHGDDYLLMTKIGLQMQMLFAFCYTYHYLNWFSKTKVINWHEVSRRWQIITAFVWVVSIALYWIDYKVAFLALFFLSMLHVFLEFPLNGLSFVGVFQELKSRMRFDKT